MNSIIDILIVAFPASLAVGESKLQRVLKPGKQLAIPCRDIHLQLHHLPEGATNNCCKAAKERFTSAASQDSMIFKLCDAKMCQDEPSVLSIVPRSAKIR